MIANRKRGDHRRYLAGDFVGLDGVELVMDVEDRFDTSIPDSAAEQIQTVGDLHEYLMDRIRNRNSVCCPSAAMFYPIRRILVDNFGIERSAVKNHLRRSKRSLMQVIAANFGRNLIQTYRLDYPA